MRYLQHSQILTVLANHGIVNNPHLTSEKLCNLFCLHLATGNCYGHEAKGCACVRHQLTTVYLDEIVLGLSILTLAKCYCNLCVLRHILLCCNVDYATNEGLQSICYKLSTNLTSTALGKQLSMMSNEALHLSTIRPA